MALQSALVVAFAQALTELTTVEKKHIFALTEIARDTLNSEPASAPSLAALISNRVVQAPPTEKLPVLYLLDSVSKVVGEPYKTLFAPSLPEVFMSAWHASGGLHRALDKLLNTWAGVYPQPLLADIQARRAAATAHALPLPAPAPAPAGAVGYPAAAPQQPGLGTMPAPGSGPLGYGAPQQLPAPAVAPYQQPMQQAGYDAYPAVQPQPPYQQPPAMQQQPYAAPQAAPQPQVNVTDLLSSLVSAGLLAAPGAQPAPAAAPAQGPVPASAGQPAAPPHSSAAGASLEPEQPATTKFTPDRLKEPNPSAVARLLRSTEATKSRFLDRKFLRRQHKAAGAAARVSNAWYLDLDTWMASTVGQAGGGTTGAAGAAGPRGAGQQQAATAAAAARALDPDKHSVPVDDMQTHCALSGEPFEQYWDETHQEWRYRGAKALDGEEAARYRLEEGAIVLVTALGGPEGAPGGGPGVLSEMVARREIADDLAAAAAAEAAAGPAAGSADVKEEEKLDMKHGLEEAGEAGGGAPEKRQRLG